MKIGRTPSRRLTLADAILIWKLFMDGMFQNRIAALLDVNPGRVNEVVKRHKFPEAEAMAKA